MLKFLSAIAVVIGLCGVVVYPVGQHYGWFGHSTVPAGTYAPDQTPPSVTPTGTPVANGPLAGSHVLVKDPQGNVIIDQAISDKFIERDAEGHISPGLIPAFYYRSGFSELPLSGQPAGTWVVAGHSGANQAFTPLVGMQSLDAATLSQYRVTIMSPLGSEEMQVANVVPVDKRNVTAKYGDDLANRVLLVACQLDRNGQPIDINIVVELVPLNPV